VKPNTFKNVYAKDPDGEIERQRTYHLNDEEETEIEKADVIDGKYCQYCKLVHSFCIGGAEVADWLKWS